MGDACPQLSHAAIAAAEAVRLLVVSAVHLEAAGAAFMPDAELELADIIEGANDYATELQRLADDYGHRQAERRRRAAA
jgi:hypothetical protein